LLPVCGEVGTVTAKSIQRLAHIPGHDVPGTAHQALPVHLAAQETV